MADKESAPQCGKEAQPESAENKQTAVEKESLPKTSPSKIETNEALQHLVQGKRHLLVRDINSAVASLQEACRLLAEQYGETADPCGEAYFFYGKALLELSRIETGVLGNALDGVPEGDDADTSQTEDPDKLSEEERMQVVEEVDEALEENFITLEKATKSKQSTEDDKKSAAESDVAAIKAGEEGGDLGKENGEVEMKTDDGTDKIVESNVQMETGDEAEPGAVLGKAAKDAENLDPGEKSAVAVEETAKDVPVTPASESDAEAMEVNGAAPAKTNGHTAPTADSVASDGKKRRPSSETPPAASEAKQKAADGADESAGDATARSEKVETVKLKSAAAGKSAEIEDKPILNNGDVAETVPDDSMAGTESKDAGGEPVKAVTAESVSKASTEKAAGDAPAVEASGDTSADKGSGTADKVLETADKASETADKASETADKASETADKASETADKASETADMASETADMASETADMASETAEKASETAEKAPETADKASETADKASEMAVKAPETAAKASETADKASETADKTSEPTAVAEADKPAFVNGKKKGDSTEGDEEDDGEEADGDGEDQPAGAEDAAAAEEEGETKEGGSDAEEGDAAKEGDTSQDCDTEEGEGEGEGEGAKEGDDEEEDVPNIQLAWEVLELAKLIFTRQVKDKPSDLKLSEVYQKLGEVSIEAENYSQAVDDLNNCLAIQKKHLDVDDRLIAETHYHLGVAHSLANLYSEAIAAFQASVDTILARVQRLQRQILDREQGKKIEHDDPFYKEETEIKELEDLLPDMKEKIVDMRDMKSEAQKKIAEIFAAGGGAGPSTSSAPISPVKAMMTSRPATSAADGDGEKKETRPIGHLVKRKRLSNEPTDEEAKRTKQENGHNGINGHADP